MENRLFSLTFIFITVICVNEVKAQNGTRFGVRAGVVGTESGTGFLGGMYAVIPIAGTSFSVQPEILYSQKVVEINNEETYLGYIRIPVFARFDFASTSLLSPHLILGPFLAIRLSAAPNRNPDSPPEPGLPPSQETTGSVLRGLMIGAGVDFNRISIGLRYSQDFRNEFRNRGGPSIQVISIVAGFEF